MMMALASWKLLAATGVSLIVDSYGLELTRDRRGLRCIPCPSVRSLDRIVAEAVIQRAQRTIPEQRSRYGDDDAGSEM